MRNENELQNEIDVMPQTFFIKYFKAAKDNGYLPTVSQLKSEMNFIDLTGILTKENLKGCDAAGDMSAPVITDELNDFLNDSLYATLPLYTHQLVRYNKGCYKVIDFVMIDDPEQFTSYIKNLKNSNGDPVDSSGGYIIYSMQVTGFSFLNILNHGRVWHTDERFEVIVIVVKGYTGTAFYPLFQIPEDGYAVEGCSVLFDIMPDDVIDFTDKERKVWNDVGKNYFRFPYNNATEAHYNTIVSNILVFNATINYMLEKSKPKAVRKSKSSGNTSVYYDTSFKGKPRRRVERVVDGGLVISSVNPPKSFEGMRSITYKTAKWDRKGFTRKLKNGGTTYVRPTECARHALKDVANNQETRHSTIILKGKS